jgi:anhydro-N-acetylmuramic acid kinase
VQLIDVKPISSSFDCEVLTDPRQRDLQLGGQGAPITPLADWIMFRDEEKSTAIVNLGGFCNVTLLPASSTPEEIRGFDVCCCNLLLNTIAHHHFEVEFDCDGKSALQGTPNVEVTRAILDELTAQHDSKRSLGTNDDLGEHALQLGSHLTPEDLLASATKAIGSCITQAVSGINRVYLAGGGVNNESLIQSIRNHGTTETLGVPTQAREGMAMAILGALAQDGVSITLPQVTGRKETPSVVGWVQASP